jgi:hypothetical protein
MKSLKEMEDVNREGKAQIKRQRKEEGTLKLHEDRYQGV